MSDVIFVHELYPLLDSVIRFVTSDITKDSPRIFEQKRRRTLQTFEAEVYKTDAEGAARGWGGRLAAR
jgi:hypothetical protein